MTDTDCDDALHQVDQDLHQASLALTAARHAYHRSPNVERDTLQQMAQRTLDELLELRHQITHVGI